MKNPYCPKCGTQMDLRYGKFGPFWSFPLCHTTRNLDGTLPNWPVMIQKKINELHTLCETYICLLQLSSPINVTQSQILADKIEHTCKDFRKEESVLEGVLSKFMERPAYAQSKLEIVNHIGKVIFQAAKSLAQIGHNQRALLYAKEAREYMLSSDPDYAKLDILIQQLTPTIKPADNFKPALPPSKKQHAIEKKSTDNVTNPSLQNMVDVFDFYCSQQIHKLQEEITDVSSKNISNCISKTATQISQYLCSLERKFAVYLNLPRYSKYKSALDNVYGKAQYNLAVVSNAYMVYEDAQHYIENALKYLSPTDKCYSKAIEMQNNLPKTFSKKNSGFLRSHILIKIMVVIVLIIGSLIVVSSIGGQGDSSIQINSSDNSNSSTNDMPTSLDSDEKDDTGTSESDIYYVGNSKSHIFHVDTCSFVNRISEQNYVEFDSRDEAIDDGYRPCKVCKP